MNGREVLVARWGGRADAWAEAADRMEHIAAVAFINGEDTRAREFRNIAKEFRSEAARAKQEAAA
jgi:hypothetical protein